MKLACKDPQILGEAVWTGFRTGRLVPTTSEFFKIMGAEPAGFDVSDVAALLSLMVRENKRFATDPWPAQLFNMHPLAMSRRLTRMNSRGFRVVKPQVALDEVVEFTESFVAWAAE